MTLAKGYYFLSVSTPGKLPSGEFNTGDTIDVYVFLTSIIGPVRNLDGPYLEFSAQLHGFKELDKGTEFSDRIRLPYLNGKERPVEESFNKYTFLVTGHGPRLTFLLELRYNGEYVGTVPVFFTRDINDAFFRLKTVEGRQVMLE